MENKQPVYSKLNAVEDGVLVCTKKDGQNELFKYIPLGRVKAEGNQTLNEILEALRDENKKLKQIIADQDKAHQKEINAIKDEIKLLGKAVIATREENTINETDPDY